VQCETDFVARTDEFSSFAREVAVHIAGAAPPPLHVSTDEIPDEVRDAERDVLARRAREDGKPDEIALALEDAITLADKLDEGTELQPALEAYERERQTAMRTAQTDARFSAEWFENVPRYADLEPPRLLALLHERRSPLLPHTPPPLYYRLHQATDKFPALRRLRSWAAPRIKALFGR
jgi:hypothetical protein